ncbi:MAG: hypothetical protein HQM11_14300 [SAR324 cluster bacterium]|nr:hypothetical protein [SAR324 cluster bacterium]
MKRWIWVVLAGFILGGCAAPSLFLNNIAVDGVVCFQAKATEPHQIEFSTFLKWGDGKILNLAERILSRFPDSTQISSPEETICENELGIEPRSFTQKNFFEGHLEQIIGVYALRKGLLQKPVIDDITQKNEQFQIDVIFQDYKDIQIRLSGNIQGLSVRKKASSEGLPAIKTIGDRLFSVSESVVLFPLSYEIQTAFIGKEQPCQLRQVSNQEYVCELPVEICLIPIRGTSSKELKMVPEVRDKKNNQTIAYLDANLKYAPSSSFVLKYTSIKDKIQEYQTQCFDDVKFLSQFSKDGEKFSEENPLLLSFLRKIADPYYSTSFKVEVESMEQGIHAQVIYDELIEIPNNATFLRIEGGPKPREFLPDGGTTHVSFPDKYLDPKYRFFIEVKQRMEECNRQPGIPVIKGEGSYICEAATVIPVDLLTDISDQKEDCSTILSISGRDSNFYKDGTSCVLRIPKLLLNDVLTQQIQLNLPGGDYLKPSGRVSLFSKDTDTQCSALFNISKHQIRIDLRTGACRKLFQPIAKLVLTNQNALTPDLLLKDLKYQVGKDGPLKSPVPSSMRTDVYYLPEAFLEKQNVRVFLGGKSEELYEIKENELTYLANDSGPFEKKIGFQAVATQKYRILHDFDSTHPIPCKQWKIEGTLGSILFSDGPQGCITNEAISLKRPSDKLNLRLSMSQWNHPEFVTDPSVTEVHFDIQPDQSVSKTTCYAVKNNDQLKLMLTGVDCIKQLNPQRVVKVENAFSNVLVKQLLFKNLPEFAASVKELHIPLDSSSVLLENDQYSSYKVKAFPVTYVSINHFDAVTKESLPAVDCDALKQKLNQAGYGMIGQTCSLSSGGQSMIPIYKYQKNALGSVDLDCRVSMRKAYPSLPGTVNLVPGVSPLVPQYHNHKNRVLWIAVNNTGEWERETSDGTEKWYHILRRIFTELTSALDASVDESSLVGTVIGRLDSLVLTYHYEKADEVFSAAPDIAEKRMVFVPPHKDYATRLLNKPPGYSTNLTADFLEQLSENLYNMEGEQPLELITFIFRDPALHSSNQAIKKLKRTLMGQNKHRDIRWIIIEAAPGSQKNDTIKWIDEFRDISDSNHSWEMIHEVINTENQLEQYKTKLIDLTQQY